MIMETIIGIYVGFKLAVLGLSGTPQVAQQPPTDVMNQQVTVNLSVNPHQVKTVSPTQELWKRVAISTWPQQIGNLLYKHRYFIASGVALGGYVLLCRECVRANRYLECCDSWGSWHKEYETELLMSMAPKDLAKDLIIEIQRRYSNGTNPTDFIGPLITFSKAIDEEIRLVNRFILLYSMLIRSRLYLLLPLKIEKYAELNNVAKRLQHIKDVFLTWAADYKIDHNRKKDCRSMV